MTTAGAASPTGRPLCPCHGEAMRWARDSRREAGGRWRCVGQERDFDRRFGRISRRIRIRAGGVQYFAGYAPTIEAAERLRARIREEAPRGVLRNP